MQKNQILLYRITKLMKSHLLVIFSILCIFNFNSAKAAVLLSIEQSSTNDDVIAMQINQNNFNKKNQENEKEQEQENFEIINDSDNIDNKQKTTLTNSPTKLNNAFLWNNKNNITSIKAIKEIREIKDTTKIETKNTELNTEIEKKTGFIQRGLASWYGGMFHGRKTASGTTYNMHSNTAAHRTLAFGSNIRVTNLSNNKSILVKINDRGPYAGRRIIDLSFASAKALDIVKSGTALVKIEKLH